MADEELPSYTPQAINDILPIYHPDDTASAGLYALRQTSPTTQTLTSSDESTSSGSSLQIKTYATGGFLNKRPHITFTRPLPSSESPAPPQHRPTPTSRRRSLFLRSPSPPSTSLTQFSPCLPVAEVRFDVHGTGTSVTYLSPSPDALTSHNNGNNNPPAYPPAYPGPSYPPAATHHLTQRLELESSSLQSLATTIDGERAYWAPHPGNKDVLELTNEAEDILARFVYTLSTRGSSWGSSSERETTELREGGSREGRAMERREKSRKGSKDAFVNFEVGTLELVSSLIPTEQAAEELLVSAVVVVERAKRRSANLGLCGAKSRSTNVATVGSWA